MELSTASAQEIAQELVKRSKADLRGKINVAFVMQAILDSFSIIKNEEVKSDADDCEGFVENMIDVMTAELAKRVPGDPLSEVQELVDWGNLRT